MKNIYIIGLLVFMAISCKEEKTDVPRVINENALEVVITKSAGDRWSEEDAYMPLPVNIGRFDSKDVIILSDRIEDGKKVSIDPIGALQLQENDSTVTYVVGIPSSEKYRTIDVEDIDELATVHSSVKWIVEQYMINRKGEYDTQLKSWQAKKSAINYLLKN